MAYATHPKRKETLAEYYIRTNGHLLGDVKVYEYDSETKEMRMIKNDKRTYARSHLPCRKI